MSKSASAEKACDLSPVLLVKDQVSDDRPVCDRTTVNTHSADAVIAALSLRLAVTPDTEFLSQCALALSEATAADFFIISRLNPDSNLMRTLCFVVDGEQAGNIIYSLDGTPCARAVDDAACCVYPENVADLFPHDKFLSDYGVNGYAGVALRAADGETLGVALALTKQPIRNASAVRTVLERFRLRIASAIESFETAERNQHAVSEATDGVWEWDVLTGGTTLSSSIQKLIGGTRRARSDLSQLEAIIHPQDRVPHSMALQDHVRNGAPFNINIRLRDSEGVYRWFRSRGNAARNEQGRAVRMVGCFIEIDDLVRAQAQGA